ncbi:MAG: transporter, family, chloramphenicol resistance protein, partial [Actinomycetota bacterium]|nr:transporter, family, chloramphenicol resistance protein [Actinomycetota bacterium]
RLWLALAAAVLVTGGWIAVFSFIAPLLTDYAGISAAFVPLVLVGFGIGALVGTNVGGHFADRIPVRTFLTSAILCTVVLVLLVALSGNPVAAVVLIVLLGVVGMSVPPVATGLAVRYASKAPTLAAALSVSAFNLGIALGSWAGGTALDSSLGAVGPAVIGAGGAALGIVPLVVLALVTRRALRNGVTPIPTREGGQKDADQAAVPAAR